MAARERRATSKILHVALVRRGKRLSSRACVYIRVCWPEAQAGINQQASVRHIAAFFRRWFCVHSGPAFCFVNMCGMWLVGWRVAVCGSCSPESHQSVQAK